MQTRTVPCLVRDPTGDTLVVLEKAGGVFGSPIWKCDDWTCEKRPAGDSCYDAFSIVLRTPRNRSIHGIVECSGVGRMERK